MPGGSTGSYFTAAKLKTAIANGSIQVARVDQAVGRILYEMDRFGLLSGKSKHTITAENTTADEGIVLRTALDSATLLKNTGNALPLSKNSLSSLAVIGPGAGQALATNSGGEAAGGLISQQTSALTMLRKETKGTGLTYAVADDLTGVPVPASALSHSGDAGLVRTTTGTTTTQVDPELNFTSSNGAALPAGGTYTWTGTLTVPTAGSYWLNTQSLGAVTSLSIDGTVRSSTRARYGILHSTDGNAPTATTDGIANNRVKVTLSAGQHALALVATADASGRPVQVRLNWVTPEQQTANHDAAVAAAKKAATAVVFARNTGSGDLATPLPDDQDQLISDIAAVNRNIVVVLQSGQPISMPWLPKVNAVLEAWYGGDQAGVAQAELLLGNANPSGRLPFTWPASLDQEVAHSASHPERSSAGVDSKTTYSEGLNIGYRYFDATNETPLYPFGYGLSYTSFG